MRKNYEGVSMKKILIMLAAMAVMGVGTAIAEEKNCVGEAMVVGTVTTAVTGGNVAAGVGAAVFDYAHCELSD